MEAKSPKKEAGNLSASSYDSECSSCEERVGKSKLEQHLRNFVIQEENDDTESKKVGTRGRRGLRGLGREDLERGGDFGPGDVYLSLRGLGRRWFFEIF